MVSLRYRENLVFYAIVIIWIVSYSFLAIDLLDPGYITIYRMILEYYYKFMLNAYIHSNRSISADNRGSRRQPDEDSNDDFCIPIQIIFEEM